MDGQQIGAIAGAVATVLVAFFAGVRSIVRELKPNGGASVRDSVDRLEKRVDEIYSLLIKS
jgi:hypothetical protein